MTRLRPLDSRHRLFSKRIPTSVAICGCDASGPIGIAVAIKMAGWSQVAVSAWMDQAKLDAIKRGGDRVLVGNIPRMQGSMSVLMLWQANARSHTASGHRYGHRRDYAAEREQISGLT